MESPFRGSHVVIEERQAYMSSITQRCCFCGYEATERTFRNVGTEKHPKDVVCNLCDTDTSALVKRGDKKV